MGESVLRRDGGWGVNEVQSLALAHPCYLAGETLHPRFEPTIAPGNPAISVKVTVNAGYE